MGKKEREDFRRELEKLGKFTEESDAYIEQNRKTWEAEKKCGPLENLWVRGTHD